MQSLRGNGNGNLNFISLFQPCCSPCFPEQLSARELQMKGRDMSDWGMMDQDKKKKKTSCKLNTYPHTDSCFWITAVQKKETSFIFLQTWAISEEASQKFEFHLKNRK